MNHERSNLQTTTQKPSSHLSHVLSDDNTHWGESNATVNFGLRSTDLIVLSHLRWDFVFQRPQHLLTRAASTFANVFFVEEPIVDPEGGNRVEISDRGNGVWVVRPIVSEGLSHDEYVLAQRSAVDSLLSTRAITNYVLWYYTPMALSFTSHLTPRTIIYDCMDELSLFQGAPRELIDNERSLIKQADLVFTGGQSLYEAKKGKHASVHAFPSSIDVSHFAQARKISRANANIDPQDQTEIPHPRMGYCGVIDERLNISLLDGMAEARPDWQFVMIGPVVKIDPNSLPKRPNIHYLGQKDYKDLPQYLAGWDVAMMPFALNDSTKFISPTKTPEYLAAGKPVVSTSITDVVRPYGEQGLVHIADTVAEFIARAAECGMDERPLGNEWLAKVDAFLSQTSWDRTWNAMSQLIAQAVVRSRSLHASEVIEALTPERQTFHVTASSQAKDSAHVQKNNVATASFSSQVA